MNSVTGGSSSKTAGGVQSPRLEKGSGFMGLEVYEMDYREEIIEWI